MTSLRARLFVILLLSTGVLWASAVSWVYLRSRAELEHVLDTRLQEAARMVSSLVAAAGPTLASGEPARLPAVQAYERQLSCQVWSLDGKLLARSIGAPASSLSNEAEGFSDRLVDGEPWRVYVAKDEASGTRVMVGDRLGLRDQLTTDLIAGFVAPAVLIIPLLGVLIWISVGRGLTPLRKLAGTLAARAPDEMRPLNEEHAPPEVRPLTKALNSMFYKLEAARSHEREFIAFAAHELRTPLTGLRMQAQIALATEDGAIVRSALQQMIIAVDRSTRLVRQLLTIARFDADVEDPPLEQVEIGGLISEIVDETGDRDGAVQTEVDARLKTATCVGRRDCLELAIRNLHENAISHTREGGVVRWSLGENARSIVVDDDGPGIPEDELDKVTGRFYRGRHRRGLGSGLGLAIVTAALARTGGSVRLGNGSTGGLRAEIVCSKPVDLAEA